MLNVSLKSRHIFYTTGNFKFNNTNTMESLNTMKQSHLMNIAIISLL